MPVLNRFVNLKSLTCHIKNKIYPVRNLHDYSTADFGFKDVNSTEKEKMVKEVFSRVANKYDVMNDFMSAGAHRLWKDEFVKEIGVKAIARCSSESMPRHLDVAGGTGDIAFRVINSFVEAYGEKTDLLSKTNSIPEDQRQVVVCDINPDMLSVGKQRAPGVLGDLKSNMIGFVEGNAEKLPFLDQSFDVYTIAFGLRNVTDKDAALREAYRVLKFGGRLLILEFSHLNNPLMQTMYDHYSFNIIPKLGDLVANDSESYRYLVESIRRFPKQEELKIMLENAKFDFCSYRNLSYGIVAIHSGFKYDNDSNVYSK